MQIVIPNYGAALLETVHETLRLGLKHEKVFKLKARERSININCKEIRCNKQKLILENDRHIKMFTKK